MSRDRSADSWSVSAHQIENTRRYSRFVENLRQQIRRKRRKFTGLQHYGASRRKSGCNFGHNLVHRPVPRSDQTAHSHRFLSQESRSLQFLKLEILHHLYDFQQVCETGRSLSFSRQRDGSTHLLRHGRGDFFQLRLVDVYDAAQQPQAVLGAYFRIRCEGSLGRGHGPVHIVGTPQEDPGNWLFSRRVDDGEVAAHAGIDPLAIDVKLRVILHGFLVLASETMPMLFRLPAFAQDNRLSAWHSLLARFYLRMQQ